MSTNTQSAKKGTWGAVPDALATFYSRRWLIWYFAQRQFTRNYRRSFLGFFWAFLSPLIWVFFLTLIFSEVLGFKFREVTGDSSLNFGLYLYCGLLPFMAFSEALNKGVNSIRGSSGLVQKVVFPLEILPLTMTITSLIDKVFGFGALMLALLVLEQHLHWTVVLLPLVLVVQLVFTLGLSYLMAVTGTFLPDVGEILHPIVRGMFFLTPILWPAEMVPESFRFLVDYNPLAYLVEAYRDLILNGKLPGGMATLYFSLFAAALFVVGFTLFVRLKHKFADLL